MIIEFVKIYGLIGIISYMPLNFNYISSEKIFLNSSNDLGMEEIWDRKQYLEYFFPFDFETPYIERSFNGLDFFKARNITINAKTGDTHFSLQWVFNSLASALDTILLVKICDKNQPLRICKYCGKLFIAENVRAEYDTLQCRNQANVYKNRERNK